jgi:hypothetical protein
LVVLLGTEPLLRSRGSCRIAKPGFLPDREAGVPAGSRRGSCRIATGFLPDREAIWEVVIWEVVIWEVVIW